MPAAIYDRSTENAAGYIRSGPLHSIDYGIDRVTLFRRRQAQVDDRCYIAETHHLFPMDFSVRGREAGFY